MNPPPQNGPDVNQMKDLTVNLEALTKVLDLLQTKMGSVDNTAKSVGDRIKDWSADTKNTIKYTDDVVEQTKELLRIQKSMSVHSDANSKEEAKAYLDVLIKQTEQIKKQNQLGKDAMHIASETEKRLKNALANLEDTNIHEIMGEASDAITQSVKGMEKLVKNVSNLHLNPFTRSLSEADKRFSSLLGQTEKLKRFTDIGARGHAFKKEFQEKVSRHKANYRSKTGNYESQAFEDVHYDNSNHGKNYKGRRGDYARDRAAYDAAKPLRERDHNINQAVERARAAGGGKLTQYIARRSAEAELGGAKPSALVNFGQRMTERGEGSVGKGLIRSVGDVVEGGAGDAVAMVGRMAPILAALEGLNLAFNYNAKKNADVHEKLGSGGIYVDGQNPLDSLMNVRSNLIGNPFKSQSFRLGIGYDKNMEIAKALNDSGISTKNLSSGNLGTDAQGFSGGSFGTLQRNVYGYGRAAGLDSNQTMAETLKLITQYKLSLQSTEDFFVHVDKDARAAGISATKYVEVIDGINSGFSDMNKNLTTTLDVMKLLSVTGRITAKDMEDVVKGLTNGDKDRSLETGTYIAMQNLRNPNLVKQTSRKNDRNVSEAIDKVAEQYGMSRAEIEKGLSDPNTAQKFMNDLERKASSLSSDPAAAQTAAKTVQGLRTEYNRRNQYATDVAMGGSRGALALTTSQKVTGNDAFGAFQNNLGALDTTLKTFDLSLTDLIHDPSKVHRNTGAMLMANQLGVGQLLDGNTLRTAALAKADQVVKFASEKPDTDYSKNPLGKQDKEELLGYISKQLIDEGSLTLNKGESNIQGIQRLAQSDEGKSLIADATTRNRDALDTIFSDSSNGSVASAVTEAEKKAQIDKADMISAGTQETGTYLARGFEYLFNKLLVPLNIIAKHFGGSSDYADQNQLALLDKLVASGANTKAVESAREKLKKEEEEASNKKGREKDDALAAVQAKKDQLAAQEQAVKDRNSGTGGIDGRGGMTKTMADSINGMSGPSNAPVKLLDIDGRMAQKTAAVSQFKSDHPNAGVFSRMWNAFTSGLPSASSVNQSTTNIVTTNQNVTATQQPNTSKLANQSGLTAAGTTVTPWASR